MLSQSDLGSVQHVLQSPPFILTSAIILFCIAAFYFPRSQENASVPFYQWNTSASGKPQKRWLWDSANLLKEGYNQFCNKPFQVWTTEGDQIALPPPYTDELKMLPDHTFPSSLRDFMRPKYTCPFEPWKLDYVNNVIKQDLNKTMTKVFPVVKEELDIAFPLEFPSCQEWTQLPVYPTVLRTISRVAGRVFVGPELSRTEEWIRMNCEYTRDIFRSAAIIRMVPAPLRPIAQYLIPNLRSVKRHNARARDLIGAILCQREVEEQMLDYEKPNDAIQWVKDAIPEGDRKDYDFQGVAQLAIGAVSIHTTTALTTNVIFDLATYPEYVSILKEEFAEVLKEHEGTWTLEAMAKLKKLDSFIRESLRYNGATTITFQRKTLKPITLHDGTTLPAGTLAFSPTNAISFDANIYPNADTFDGLRFYNLRQVSPEDDRRYHLTSTSKTQMQFGGGRHACPGRWFASYEIKLIIIKLLERYEVALNEGEGRPKTIVFQAQQVPNPTAKIRFRDLKK
ncbi:cytochrome P450 [Acephala macrosclerotiorum]|nr:cytochrome P450 [Acephala macrosclerotiorum]